MLCKAFEERDMHRFRIFFETTPLCHTYTNYTWYSMLYDNIRIKILSMKIFFQILFVWEENDLLFSSELEKIALKQQHKNSPLPPPPPHTHTHTH